MAHVISEFGNPPFWTREPGFASLVLFILEQQVSLASAAAAFRRLEVRTGAVTPESILESPSDDLRTDGFSRQKSGYVSALATSLVGGEIDLTSLASCPDDDVRSALTALKGIGPWTADVYLLSCLRRPDIWPVGDRAIQVGVAETLSLDTVPGPELLQVIGERWAPYRSTAARIIWHGYLSRRPPATPTPHPA